MWGGAWEAEELSAGGRVGQGDGRPADRLLWQAKLWRVEQAERALLDAQQGEAEDAPREPSLGDGECAPQPRAREVASVGGLERAARFCQGVRVAAGARTGPHSLKRHAPAQCGRRLKGVKRRRAAASSAASHAASRRAGRRSRADEDGAWVVKGGASDSAGNVNSRGRLLHRTHIRFTPSRPLGQKHPRAGAPVTHF